MSFNPGKDWSKESDDLFIHKTGTRIAKTSYQGTPGWYIMPVDLDSPVVPFPATEEGRDKAFETYAKGLPKKKKKKVEPKKGGKPIKLGKRGGDDDEVSEEPGEEPAVAVDPAAEPAEAVDADEDDEDEDEDDEKEPADEKE